MQIGMIQFDGIEIVALSYEKVLPSIIVEVEKSDSPA